MHRDMFEHGHAAVLHAPDAHGMFLLRFCKPDEHAEAGGGDFGPVIASLDPASIDACSWQSMVEMSARGLLAALRQHQARGPYRLAGWGGAGLLAHEMAYRLIGADERIGFLGLVATPFPEASRFSLAPLPVPVTVLVAEGADGMALAARWKTHGAPRTAVRTVGTAAGAQAGMPAPGAWLAALADSLRSHPVHPAAAEEQGYAPAVALQSGKRGAPPLFCIPGAGASITAFMKLTDALGGEVPVVGMQPRGLCGRMVPHIDVESAAASYVKALLAIAPRGPFHLAGHSYGGWIAFEMGRRLAALGRPPASLFVMDSRSPRDPARSARYYSSARALAKLVELYNMQLDKPIPLGAADFAPLSQEARLALLLSNLVSANILPRQASAESLRGVVQVFQRNLNTAYVPPAAYVHPVEIVTASDDGTAAGGEDVFAAWRMHAPAARHWSSPGNHMTLLSPPFVGALASHMKSVMRHAEGV